MVFSLKLLGGVSLEGGDGRVTGPAVQRHRLAILALLATSRPRALTRDRLMAWLWPESDTEHARGNLNQAVHVLRRALGGEAILTSGEELQLNTAVVACDVIAFEEALSAGDLERSAGLYAGPFLDGFFLSDAPEFEQWLGRERDRLSAACARALEGLAQRAEAAGDRAGAVRWWKARTALDPYDSSVALRLILALEASGNRAAALLEAGAHQRLLKEELDMAPPPDLLELTERLRSSPTAILPRKPREPEQAASKQGAEGDSRPLVAAAAPEAPRPSRTRRSLPYAVAAILTGGAVLGVMLLRSRPTDSPPVVGNVSASAVDEIARAVARELDRRQRGDTAVRQAPHRTRSIAAYELYLRGSDPAALRSDSAARQGLEYFRRAVALDSGYAAAWAGLARMTVRTSLNGDPVSRKQALSSAEAAARRAIALDDSLAEAHATLGLVRVNQSDLPGAESELRRAIALEPGAARNYEYLVRLYAWLGRGADALTAARRALELEPLSPSATAELARALLANGQYDQALAQLDKIAGLDPPLQRAAPIAAQCYAGKQMWKEAVAAVRPQAERGSRQTVGLFGYLLARAGQREEATRVLGTLLEQDRSTGGQALNVALVYAGLDDVDEALAWLRRAVDDQVLIAFSEAAPTLTGILDSRPGDPRVVSLRRSLGLQNR
jgi:DNA-binding SARP family transcriptional activator/tetratricopeptide (TPR) repeat protein